MVEISTTSVGQQIKFSESMDSKQLSEACATLLSNPGMLVRNGRDLIIVAGKVGSIPSRSAESFLTALDAPNSKLTWHAASNYVESVAKGLPAFVATLEAFDRANHEAYFVKEPINVKACRIDHRLFQKSLDRVRRFAPEAIQGETW